MQICYSFRPLRIDQMKNKVKQRRKEQIGGMLRAYFRLVNEKYRLNWRTLDTRSRVG